MMTGSYSTTPLWQGAAADSIGMPVEIAADAAEIPRDDWPYLYISHRTIPRHYLEALGMVLIISLLFIRIGGGKNGNDRL